LLPLGEVELVLVCTLFGRGGLWCLIASVEVVLDERGVRYSQLYLYKILGGGSLDGSPRWTS